MMVKLTLGVSNSDLVYLNDHEDDGVDEVERDEGPVLGADVRDDEARARKWDVEGSGEESGRQDGHDRHGPDDKQDCSNSSGLKKDSNLR